MIIILFGLLCGVALGLTGGGGSILAVPLLIYGLGLPFHNSVTLSLVFVAVTALFGFIPKLKSGEVELSAGVTLAITGILFAPIGSYLSRFIDSHILLTSFSILMLAIAIWSFMKSKIIMKNQPNNNAACHYLPNGKLHLSAKCKSVLFIAGVVTGMLTGLFGVGGGFLIVPALTIAAKIPIRKAISTSLLIIFLISTSGFIAHLGHIELNWNITLLFLISSISGMMIAVNIKKYLNDLLLQRIFASALLLVSVIMLIIQYSNLF